MTSTFGLLEPWSTFRDLGRPPLISSSWRTLSTLPERYPRSLGKFLPAFYFSSRRFFSPWHLIHRLRRGMPSHSNFDFVFLYGAMSSSSPPRTNDVRVVDTSLIFYVIALTFGQPFYGSRTVLSLPVSLRDFYY